MQCKRAALILACFILTLVMLSAANEKLEITLTKNTFKANEDIAFRVSIYDASNKVVYDDVQVTLEDAEATRRIEQTINSKDIATVDLGDKSKQGQWKITAIYNDIETTANFFVEASEEVLFTIENDKLIIKNIGNIRVNKEIQIVIGETAGDPRQLILEQGEEKSYRLIAPEGAYDIKVLSSKDGKVLFSKTQVALQGKGLTGEAIGAIDEAASGRTSLTGGISPDEESDEAFLYYMKNSPVAYVFIGVILAAMVLLAIERKYTRNIISKKK